MLTHAQHTSPTAVICENLEQFGGAPARGEPDPRAIWDESEALAGLEIVLDAFVEEIAPDGTQLADEREKLSQGFHRDGGSRSRMRGRNENRGRRSGVPGALPLCQVIAAQVGLQSAPSGNRNWLFQCARMAFWNAMR